MLLAFTLGVLVGFCLSALAVGWGRWIGEGQLAPARKRRAS